MNNIKQFFLDLLTVNDPEKKGNHHWSQSRVYLLISLLVFFGMAISSYFLEPNNANFQHAIDGVLWAVILFSSYALVSKGLKYKQMKDMLGNMDNPKVKKAIDWAKDKMDKDQNNS